MALKSKQVNMKDSTIFVLKVLTLSTLISLVVKYGGRLVAIAPTNLDASLAVISLPLLMSLLFAWRWLEKYKFAQARKS